MASQKWMDRKLSGDLLLIESGVGIEIQDSEWPAASLQENLEAILYQLDGLVMCDACALLLLNNGGMTLAACRGLVDPDLREGLRVELSENRSLRRLIQKGQPVVSQNLSAHNPLNEVPLTADMGSCVCAPLVYRERPIGLLLTLKKETDYYSRKDALSVTAFANQAALAIGNIHLYAESRRRAVQLEVASQVSRKISSILDLDELLAEVVRLVRDRFGYYHVHIFLVDGRSNEIVLRECSGEADETLMARGLRLKIGKQGITGWVAKTGQVLLCNDVMRESRFHPHELVPETRSELAIPLKVGDAVVGVLDVQSKALNAFGEDDLRILQILADQVAIAIENAHLFQETRRQVEVMEVLHNISLDITSQLDSERVLKLILEQAARLLGVQGSTLGIFDPEKGVVRKIAGYNLPEDVLGVELEVGEGVAGQVIAVGRPVVVNDYRSWPRRSPKFKNARYNAVMGVPLRWQNQVVGVLDVLDERERRPFTQDDAQLLSLFADLATIALKNAELYERVRQASEDLEQKVAQRTRELSEAKQELARKAEQLQRLLRITIDVQEEERIRIARDLHDSSNQLITGALYEIQAAGQSLQSNQVETALEKLGTAKELLRMIEAENRRIIAGLRPPTLDLDGLVAALNWHVEGFQKHYGIACSVEVSGEPIQLASEVETAVYRIVQESLNNVAEHSQAQRVHILVDFRPEELKVEVADNGRGFDRDAVLAAAANRMGLIGMQERAESLGGRLEVQSEPGAGTRITFRIPLNHVRPEDDAAYWVD